MSKSKLVDYVSAQTGASKTDAKKAVEATLAGIKEITEKDGKLLLVGFGSFKQVTRAARTGRNPQTGAAIQIAEKTVVKFTASEK